MKFFYAVYFILSILLFAFDATASAFDDLISIRQDIAVGKPVAEFEDRVKDFLATYGKDACQYALRKCCQDAAKGGHRKLVRYFLGIYTQNIRELREHDFVVLLRAAAFADGDGALEEVMTYARLYGVKLTKEDIHHAFAISVILRRPKNMAFFIKNGVDMSFPIRTKKGAALYPLEHIIYNPACEENRLEEVVLFLNLIMGGSRPKPYFEHYVVAYLLKQYIDADTLLINFPLERQIFFRKRLLRALELVGAMGPIGSAFSTP